MAETKRKKRAAAKRRAPATNAARAKLKHRSKTGEFVEAPHKVTEPEIRGGGVTRK
jgi:hypothetical protein